MSDIMAIIEDAEYGVDTYKNPDLRGFREVINPICIALGLGSPGEDKITSIYQRYGFLHISTEYEVRCCVQTGNFDIPLDIIRSENPVVAAGLCIRTENVITAKNSLVKATKAVDHAAKEVATAMDELNEFKEKNGIV
jgi:hypothetical protein